jgi:transcriptional regulator with XRE-family HTH domain
MVNDNLYQALENAQLAPEDLAELVRVDIRTVRRWLSGKPPYPRHRAKIAHTLKLTEQALWPDIPASTETQPRDLITGYPDAGSIAIPSTETLIQTAQEQIELLVETLGDLLLSDGVIELLIQKAGEGVAVRIMVSETTLELASLLGHAGIELRVIKPEEQQSIHRYDEQMLITLPLTGDPGDPPLIHIRRKGSDGLFDRFAAHLADSWEHSTPLTSQADLRYYLAEHDPNQAGQRDSLDRLAREPATTTPAPSRAAEPRRWPRRPSDSST